MSDHSSDYRIHIHPILGETPGAGDVSITFDGRQVLARAGESIATALQANGYRSLRTMPMNGSPRGVFCGIGRCPDCMMIVDGQLNVRSCVTAVREGMVVETQEGHGFQVEHA